MRVSVNGKETEVAAGTSVADLIAQYKLPPRHVAVEINRELVPRAAYAATQLSEGDQIEVVTLVGGG